MATNYLSPSVQVQEFDNTLTTPTVGTFTGAAVIQAGWGPVDDPQYCYDENVVVSTFGKPNDRNYRDWLCAANYLQYTGSMYITRAMSDLLCNASSSPYPLYGEDTTIPLVGFKRYVEVQTGADPETMTERGYYSVSPDTEHVGKYKIKLNYDGEGNTAIPAPKGEEERYFRYDDGSGSAQASQLVLQSYFTGVLEDDTKPDMTLTKQKPCGGKIYVKVARTTQQGFAATEFYNNTGAMESGTFYETWFNPDVVATMVKSGQLAAADVLANNSLVFAPIIVNDSFEKDVYKDGKFETAKFLVYKNPFSGNDDPYFLALESDVDSKVFWKDTTGSEAVWRPAGYYKTVNSKWVPCAWDAVDAVAKPVTTGSTPDVTRKGAKFWWDDRDEKWLPQGYFKEVETSGEKHWVECAEGDAGAKLKEGTHLCVSTNMFAIQQMCLFVKYDDEGNRGDYVILGDRYYEGTNGAFYQQDSDDYVSYDVTTGGAILHKMYNVEMPNTLVIKNAKDYEMNFAEDYNSVVGEFGCRFPGARGNSLLVTYADASNFDHWSRPVLDDFGNVVEIQDFSKLFDYAPGTSTFASEHGCSNDEIHLLVIDKDGLFTGVKGAILEKYSNLSKASDGKSLDGASTFYKKVLADQSAYVYCLETPGSRATWGKKIITENGVGFTFENAEVNADGYPILHMLSGGQDDYNSTTGQIIAAFDLYKDREQYDVTNIICGSYNKKIAKHVIQNICEDMMDCVAFVSPNDDAGGPIKAATAVEIGAKTIKWREDSAFNVSSSYAVMDSGFKYMYDKYNDEYRWVPLCGDIAGLRARTAEKQYPWFSEAGYNRGQIKGVVKLSFNPNKAIRDLLYPKGINPVVTFTGEGTILYGDKTLLAKPSAFQHTNVRFLFLYLEKTLKTAAKYLLFEINDEVTRRYAVNLVEPFLDQVMGSRGIYAYKVVCDTTNNTPLVIDSNQFVMDIKVQPARSINWITLNFYAEKTGSSFTES